jgi:UDP-GlcNAc3NAcA epimerase
MRILTIVGARPQFVKAAALSRSIAEKPGLEELIVHTGQHFDANMSDVFFEEMAIPKPAYNLHINSLGHGAMTGRMLEEIEKILKDVEPDMLLVYGDTNSTIAGALAAKKLHIKVGHVEAGLRSFNMEMPEEINRILCDRISDHLFCPTDSAIDNLMKEGFENFDCAIHRTGDVMQDAALFYAQQSSSKSRIRESLNLSDPFALATIHRAENTDDPVRLQGIVDALNSIHSEMPVVCPIHPRTRGILKKLGIEASFKIIDPVGYFDMIELLKHSAIVLTDSGGLQKEAFFFSSPCVTLRDQTEWVELVSGGYNQLAGAEKETIIEAFHKMLGAKPDFQANLYGSGNAANNIAEILSAQ